MTGRFITLEGGEGAGKTTQVLLLAEALRARGRSVVATREPGGAPGAEALRALLLDPARAWSPLAETMLHAAARAEHVAVTIIPALESGAWVLSDRYTDSTMAYQGFAQGGDRAVIARLADIIGLVPDLTLILDVSEAVAAARRAARPDAADRYERMGDDFHARVRAAFRAIAAENPARCALIDADPDPEAVHAAIVRAVDARL